MSVTVATCPRCRRELPDGAFFCPVCGARAAGAPRVLRRRRDTEKLAGVCSGLAEYFDQDPVFVRALYAVATFFTGIAPGVVLYVILAVVLPSE
jgi:phage shock protein C